MSQASFRKKHKTI